MEREREAGFPFNWMPGRERNFSQDSFGCPRFLRGNQVARIAESIKLSIENRTSRNNKENERFYEDRP